MSNIKLIKGDCLEQMKNIPDKSIDMILCDLPYGTTACKWDIIIPFDKLWEQYNRIIKLDGIICLFGSQPFTSKLICSNIDKFRYSLIWEKEQATNRLLCNIMPMKKHEDINIFYNDKIEIISNNSDLMDIREYFLQQLELSGLKTCKQINEVLGMDTNGGGMASHYFGKKIKQWSLPTENMYKKLQTTGYFKKPYIELKKEYEKAMSKYKITYNPQFSKGKEYIVKHNKKEGYDPILGTTIKRTDTINKGIRYPTSILKFNRDLKNRFHPTQKPVALLEYLIKTYSNENDLVLDNCMGSASTGIACINTNRNFIGIEKDDKYFDISCDRINTYIKDNNLEGVNVEIESE